MVRSWSHWDKRQDKHPPSQVPSVQTGMWENLGNSLKDAMLNPQICGGYRVLVRYYQNQKRSKDSRDCWYTARQFSHSNLDQTIRQMDKYALSQCNLTWRGVTCMTGQSNIWVTWRHGIIYVYIITVRTDYDVPHSIWRGMAETVRNKLGSRNKKD